MKIEQLESDKKKNNRSKTGFTIENTRIRKRKVHNVQGNYKRKNRK